MVASEVINPLPFSTGLMLLIVFSLIALFVIDPLLTLVGLVLFPAMFALNRFYTRRVELPAQTVQERVGDVSAITHESFEGVMVVKTLGRQDAEVERLGRAADQLRVARVRVGALRALFEPTLDALPNLAIIMLLAIGGWRVSTGAVSPGDLVQAMALFTLLAFPMRVVGFLLEEMPRSVVALDRIDGVLAASPEAVPPDPSPLPSGGLDVEAHTLEYGYVAGVPVLQHCDVRIAAGEVVALVGPTGCGKTTLCELLAGLDRPERGVVRVGGIDLTEVARGDLRASVALVFQESFLFTDTIANNISIGTEAIGTDADDTSMRWAAGISQVARFVESLPAGYDTSMGERGVTVSGGQRQRIALARALVRRPRFLLLDDATSAVDATVEARILHGLRDELDMTTLIVAHRVSTIALADRVLFMQEGRIVATGTHTELLSTNRDYEAMVRAYEQEVA
jgi:ABC-type multidrug transport system fused ATPase/permease subunit